MAIDLSERLRQPISVAELERRWAESRRAMADEGVDCLVMQTTNGFLGMYVRWFTDIFVETGYAMSVVFDARAGMTTINHGPWGERSAYSKAQEGLPAAAGIERKVTAPYFVSCNNTATYDAELAVQDLRARGAKRVGVVGPAVVSAAFHNYLVASLPGVEIVDFTERIDRIQVIKSPEEQGLIRECARLQDEVWAETLNFIRPGVREYELRAEIQKLCVQKGSEEQWIMIGSAPPGEASTMKPTFYQNRTIRPGDQVTIMVEVNGPGGYYCELNRTACLGSIPDDLGRAWEVAVEAQRLAAQRYVPGARPAELLRAHNDFLVARGYSEERRIYSHGQGYNLVERPLVRQDETMALMANMHLSIHPELSNDAVFANINDNYLITEQGAARLHKTPPELVVI